MAPARSDFEDASSWVLLAQEAERKRVASELHDGLGQSLTVIKYLVEDLISAQRPTGNTARTGTVDVSELEPVVQKIQDAIEEVRRTALNLRPAMLDDQGLVYALEWLRREIELACPGLAVDSEVAISEQDVPEPLKFVVFRLIQEGLNNVAKHARASRALVTLEREKGCMRLVIADNGRGFQLPERIDTLPGLGLVNMQQRAILSGGKMSIASTPDEGTVVTVIWPQ